MNTVFFYILQGLFALHYLVEFVLWYRLKKYEPYKRLPKSKYYRFVTFYIAVVLAILITGAFMMDEPARFRLLLISVLLLPVLSIQIKTLMVYISVVNELENKPKPYFVMIRLRCLILLKCSILFYAVLLPMVIIYLKEVPML